MSAHEPIELKVAIEQFAEAHASELVAIERDIKSLIAGDTDANLENIEAHLGALYGEAEGRGDSVAMQQIAASWELTQQLAAANTQLLGVATGATYGMNKAIEERDELVEAIEDEDDSHPLIGRLIEAVQEQAYYDSEMDMYDHLHDLLLDNAIENICDMLGITDYQTARSLALLVCYGNDGYGDNCIPDEVQKAIGRFVAERLGAKDGA